MDIAKFVQQAEAMNLRLTTLYQYANTLPARLDILPQAFLELGSASEMVQKATEELYQQNEELIQTRDLVEGERQHYRDLFEEAPDGYLVTNAEGVIQEANRAALTLLGIAPQFLVGKHMINFIATEVRHRFRSDLNLLAECDRYKELVVHWQSPRDGKSFDAALTVTVSRDRQGKPIFLRWLIRDITGRQQIPVLNQEYEFTSNRPTYQHYRGETISLNRQIIWYVRQGWVKLTTHCAAGEEILLGLVGPRMIFGSSLTNAATYQATAMSNVELVGIAEAELASTPVLSHNLYPKIIARLRQTEALLAISGKRQVQERLHQLLAFLKVEIGQSTPNGIRLEVRLTHEEIASACCTTRVTITRLLGKLQQQGLISFDKHRHIVFSNFT